MRAVPIATFAILVIFLGISCGPGGEKTASLDSTAADSMKVRIDTAAWAFDPANEYLGIGVPEFGDLDSMIGRRKIRALVPFTHLYYYIDGKERRGVAFDVLNMFEKSLNDQLKFYPPKVRVLFIPVARTQVIPLLNAGYGDIGYAGLTITEERKKEIDFTMPTITGLKEIVVGGLSSPKLYTLADLAGKELYVHIGSTYEAIARKLSDSLQQRGMPPILIRPVDPYLETEDMLELVNSGVIPYSATVLDLAQLWSHVMDSLVLYDKMPLMSNVSYGWAIRKGSPKLKRSADKFIATHAKGTMVGNMLYKKYVKDVKRLPKMHSKKTVAQVKALRATFQKYAEQYQLDWLLLIAQGYQESALNQEAVSQVGAVGIMQVLPSTAAGRPLYIKNIRVVENNVHAGVKYMRWLIDTYCNEPKIDELNRQLFALAAYNAGPGRLIQLRKMAKARGLNPNLWFDNVELIAAREIGRETVQYVSNIYKFYASYRALNYYIEQRGRKIIP